jgi:hypothetical protein
LATARFPADEIPDGHAHGAPAEPPRSEQLGAHLVDRARSHALLAARDPDVIDPKEPGKLHRELTARP